MLGSVILYFLRPFGNDVVSSAVFMMALTALLIFLVDLGWQKVYLRASTGLSFDISSASWPRTGVKLVGLLSSIGFIGLLYWLFPEYHGPLFNNYFLMLKLVLPAWLVCAVPYFYYVDSKMVKPLDGYWHAGKAMLLQWGELDPKILGQHVLGWLIKGFFLALMFTYMTNDLSKLVLTDRPFALDSFGSSFNLLFDFSYFLDVGLVSTGYLVSLRLTDTHLRSAEPTMFGWVVALACYDPFWAMVGSHYLSYEAPFKWGAWLGQYPIVYAAWGSIILLLTFIYVWATVSFGARFSNLTHRGIITNGPYRWTKHPAYVAKNLSWWMISIPFIAGNTPLACLRNCLLLLGLNTIYLLRAMTEEWHLSRDPDYLRYADWIDNHGIFNWFKPKKLWTILKHSIK